MSDEEKPEYEINEGALLVQVMAGVRVLAIVSGGFTAVMGFLPSRDVAGFWVWLQQADGVKFIAALIAVGTFVYGQYKTRMRHKLAVWMANKLPDKVVKVKGTKDA